MILAAHSDTAYLNETRSCIHVGSHIFCSDNDPIPGDNGPVLSLAQIINVVMSPASEAELAGLLITAKAMVPLRLLYFCYDFNWQCSYDTYQYIYQFLVLQFNSNLMPWWSETDFSIKPWSIVIILDLVFSFIPDKIYSR